MLFDYYQALSTADPAYVFDGTEFVATGFELILEAGDIAILTGQTEVAINIKPGSDPNSINTCSNGTTPVAILGSDQLDVALVDPDSLVLASATVKTVGKSNRTLCSIQDVGGVDAGAFDSLGSPDGYDDLVCHFVTFELTELEDESTEATLTGNLLDGASIAGSDSVNIVKDCS